MRVLVVAGVWAMLAAAPAIATTHHRHHDTHPSHHGKTHPQSKSAAHHAKASHGSKTTRGKPHAPDKKHRPAEVAHAPSGVIPVGSGGAKLFCPGHASPLLVRKATQGSGTTVTVICR